MVALCNYVSDTGKSHPSVQTICKITSLHDETVRRSLAGLVEQGIIADTGKKVGATQQVKVYQLPPEAWYVEGKTPENKGLKDSAKTRTRPVQDPGFTGAEPVTSNQEPEVQRNILPQLRSEVGKHFNRGANERWANDEEYSLVEVAKRPAALEEFDVIRAYYHNGAEFKRQSVKTLLENWPGELDKARNHKPKETRCF